MGTDFGSETKMDHFRLEKDSKWAFVVKFAKTAFSVRTLQFTKKLENEFLREHNLSIHDGYKNTTSSPFSAHSFPI